MGYSVVDVADIPAVWGTFESVRHHDERESRQEEVYLTLSGGGTFEIDGEMVEMKAGRHVLLPAESRQRPGVRADGMSFLVIGGVPDGVYEPWSPPNE